MRCKAGFQAAVVLMPVLGGIGCSGSASEPTPGPGGAAQASPTKAPAALPGTTPAPEQVGLIQNEPGASPGYTLLAPLFSTSTYLLDMQGRVVHQWKSDYRPGLAAYLLDNGHLLRAGAPHRPHPGFPPLGGGSRVQEFTWDGELVWDFEYAGPTHCPHHDIVRLPNGNVLMIVWEKKTAEEAIAAGRNPDLQGDDDLPVDVLIEVKPTGRNTGQIVWKWQVWDHLIQDHDPTKANYGDVAAHPERIDINFSRDWARQLNRKDIERLRSLGYLGPATRKRQKSLSPDLTHINSVDYNAELDQIVLSVFVFGEVWVIDHSTTTAEAAGRTGGRWGRGGDLLYRWGNPRAYRAGTAADQQLFAQHDAQWIARGLPGAGHLLVFNNGLHRPPVPHSSVDEIVPPIGPDGRYVRQPGAPYGPDKPVWSYTAPRKEDFYSMILSGAQRLPNGNTLVCAGGHGVIFEVTPAGQVVWKYVNPVKGEPPGGPGGGPPMGGPGGFGPPPPGGPGGPPPWANGGPGGMPRGGANGVPPWLGPPGGTGVSNNQIFRVSRYAPDYPGLAGKDLTPGKPLEVLLVEEDAAEDQRIIQRLRERRRQELEGNDTGRR